MNNIEMEQVTGIVGWGTGARAKIGDQFYEFAIIGKDKAAVVAAFNAVNPTTPCDVNRLQSIVILSTTNFFPPPELGT